MRLLARRFFFLFCALALIGGSTISFAATVTAASPCAHEHSEHGSAAPAQHHHHGAGCLACCLGACTATSGMPPRSSFAVGVIFTAKAVTYWKREVVFSDRSIAPDPAPPRTIS